MLNNFLKKYTNDIFIIAEIGVNHNGDINLAKKLIDVSKEANANAVKFQTFKTEKLVQKDAPKAEYQKQNTKDDSSQYEMIKKLELSKNDFIELKKYAEEKNIMFISTPFDLESVDILDDIGVEIFKVGSGDCDNFILLSKIIKTQKPVIISTGMADFDEIEIIKKFMDQNNYQNKYIFLHCLSSYPAPFNQMNMSCIKTLYKKLNVPIGFSDHTIDDIAGIMSVAYGAVCIEKHITLDNNMEGPDHKASLNPENFKNFVENMRKAEGMIGDGNKRCMLCEENTKMVARKNLVYIRDMNKGEIIEENDIEALRPNIDGISPMYYYDIVGKQLLCNVKKGSNVKKTEYIFNT
jgi:N,N'-diacetyllegionaminate synthase